MSKIIRTVATVAAVAGLAVVTGGAAAGLGLSMATTAFGVSAGALLAASSALSIGASLLYRPKAPQVSEAATDRLTANIDPRTPRKFVFGRTAFATDIRDQELTGTEKDLLHRFIVCASHQVNGFSEIWLDDKLAWTASGGVTSEFAGYLLVDVRTVGNANNVLNISPRMGTTRRYTGCAWIHLRFKTTGNNKKAQSPFAQSVPSRVTIIGEGALTYDPRLDSTVPGGSGPMRANDQTTWAWNADASRNPALQLLWYLLGWRIQNPATGQWRLAVGKGIPAARIDLQSFITAANLCDEPVTLIGGGTQPRFRSDGLFSEGDATSTVLDQLKAAMNAELDDVDGKIRLTVLHNDLATPIADFSEDDILSGFTWEQTAPLDQMFNVVRGTFIDASQNSLFQAIDYPEVRIPSPDGIDRIETVNFQTVQDGRQAQRLVKQRVARMLYSGRFTATFSYRAWKVQKNDVIRLTFAPLGWTNKLFRVIETAVQVDGQVPMVLQVEHPDIYLWDRDERADIQPVEPTTYDPYLNPIYQDVIDPKYDNGDSINDLKPAEPGATDGMNPSERTELDLIDQYVENMRPRVDAAEQAIIDLQNSVIPPDIDELRDRILAAEGDIQSIETTLGGQDARITIAQTTADTTAGNLAELTTRVGTAESNITQTLTAIDTVEASITQVSLDLQAQDARVSQNALAIDTVEGAQASLSTDLDVLGASVSSLAVATSTLQGQAATLTQQVTAGNGNRISNGSGERGTAEGWYSGYGGWNVAPSVNVWGYYIYVANAGPFGAKFYHLRHDKVAWNEGHPATFASGMDFSGSAPGCQGYLEVRFFNASMQIIGQYEGGHLIDGANFANDATNRQILKVTTAPAPAGTFYADCTVVFYSPDGVSLNGGAFRKAKLEQGSVATVYDDEASSSLVFQALNTLNTQYAALDLAVQTQGVDVGLALQAITQVEGDVTLLYGRAALMVDVAGRSYGIEINGTPIGGGIDLHADYLRITSPSGGARGEFRGGTLFGYDGVRKRYQLGNQALA